MSTLLTAALLLLGPIADPPHPFLFAQGFAGPGERAAAGDLDGDGFADLATLNGAADIWVSRNEGGQRAHGPQRWAHGVARPEEPAAWGDFDGNGRLDLAAIRRDGRIVLARPDAPERRFNVTVTAAVAPAAGEFPLYAEDADGDRIDDLFLVLDGEVFLMRSTGRGGFDAPKKLERGPAWLEAAGKTGAAARVDGAAAIPVPEGGTSAMAAATG